MTRIRKFFKKEMLTEQLNQVLRNQDDEYNVAPSRSNVSKSNTEETEKKHGKRKRDYEEVEWNPKDSAVPLGEVSKVTGKGEKKTSHFERFKFHGIQYGLEDSVLVVPEDPNGKPYPAIIKDIYIPKKEKYVKLEVQWFYRPEDVDKKHIGKWESKDSRNLFYSFHHDEVFAESVQQKCVVHFVPENNQIPNRKEHPGFIVQNVYDIVKKKLRKFSDNELDVHQRQEIDHLVAETVLRVGNLPNIETDQMTKMSRRKRYVPKRSIRKSERTNPGTSRDYESILEDSAVLSDGSDRERVFEELMEAVKHQCRKRRKMKPGDYEFYWPDDVVPVVEALEQVLYDSLAGDMSKYKQKLKILVNELKNSRVLAGRLLDGELKPEQVIKMTRYELVRGFTFDEMKADLREPILKEDASSTSKSVGR